MRFQGLKLFFLYFLIANLYLVASNFPLFILISRAPKETVFPLYHSNAPYDYNVYLSVITLGQNDYLLNRDAFTSEETRPGIFYFYYILLGKISAIFNLWPPIAYHLSRFVIVELFILSSFLLSCAILGKRLGFWASAFALFGTISPPFLFNEKGALTDYTPWWSSLEALKRLDGLPHHLFGQLLLLLSLLLIFQYLKTGKLKYLFSSCLSVLAQGIFLPPSLFPILFGIPLIFISLKVAGRMARIGLIVILIFAIIPLLISFWQTKQGYPWSVWINWEIEKWNFREPNFNRALLFSFGILLPLSLPATISAIRQNSFKLIFVSLWAYLPFLLLPFVNFLGIGKIRLISAAPFVPFAILTSVTIFTLIKRGGLRILLILLFLSSTLPTTFQLFKRDLAYSQTVPFYTNIFIPKKVFKTVDFIKQNVPKDSIILSNEFVGNIIPAYSTTISYFGHINQTMDFAEKQKKVVRFFGGAWNEKEAKDFLSVNKIRYIYFGQDEKLLGNGSLNYSFLKKIFQDGEVEFYKVEEL